jgi:plasmid stabilization system protein ParE
MNVVFTEAALADLDDILAFVALHYPALAVPFYRIVDGHIEILHIHHAARQREDTDE